MEHRVRLTSMTEGVIWKQILLFMLPLLLGNFFQLFYSTVDSVIVGRFVSDQALAAVGASNPIINLIIGFFIGAATGAGVLVSRYFGSGRHEELSLTVHTFIVAAFWSGVFLLIVGSVLSPWFLRLLDTPDNIMADATLFLRVYFFGIIATMLYNAGTGILQAVGDSRSPLEFLIIANFINLSLDFLFVLGFKWGIAGAAWATFTAQSASAVMVLWRLSSSDGAYRLVWHKLRVDRQILREIIRIGIPTGLQQSIISFSNLLVQGYVNSFGDVAIAGFTAANRINDFLGLPSQSFGLAVTTFTAQNLGARHYERVRLGVRDTLMMAVVTIIALGIPFLIFTDLAMSLFTTDPDIIRVGGGMLRIMISFYVCLPITGVFTGAIRGSGITMPQMIIQVSCYCIARQVFLWVSMPLLHDVNLVAWGYSLTWMVAAVATSVYAARSHWLERYILERS